MHTGRSYSSTRTNEFCLRASSKSSAFELSLTLFDMLIYLIYRYICVDQFVIRSVPQLKWFCLFRSCGLNCSIHLDYFKMSFCTFCLHGHSIKGHKSLRFQKKCLIGFKDEQRLNGFGMWVIDGCFSLMN